MLIPFWADRGWDITKVLNVKDERCTNLAEYIFGAIYLHQSCSVFIS